MGRQDLYDVYLSKPCFFPVEDLDAQSRLWAALGLCPRYCGECPLTRTVRLDQPWEEGQTLCLNPGATSCKLGQLFCLVNEGDADGGELSDQHSDPVQYPHQHICQVSGVPFSEHWSQAQWVRAG